MALRLAGPGRQVIAGAEIIAQVTELRGEARERGVELRVEKLDVTDAGDRAKAWSWDVDVRLNNAAIAEGRAVVDLLEDQLRRQFDPEPVYEVTVAVLTGANNRYRKVVPDDMVSTIHEQLDSKWERQQNDGSAGARSELVEKAHEIAPATPAD